MALRGGGRGRDAATQLSWDQVLAWRLARHRLDERAAPGALEDVVGAVCGLHAQLLSSAELSLWARVEGLARGTVDQLLWADRRLVKTWAMRGTLHLLPAGEYPLWQGALSAYRHYLKPGWLRAFEVTEEELERLLSALEEALDGRLLTREELAATVADITGVAKLESHLKDDSWGALLKPASFRGHLCFAPNDGQKVRFTAPRSWLGEFAPVPAEAALPEMTRRYLAAYGPATREDYSRWNAHTPAQAGKMMTALGDEITVVDVEGTPGWMRAEDAEAASTTTASHAVRLLPRFDPWVIGASRDTEHLCPGAFRDRVYRKQGWVSPVVLVGGRMQGVWRHEEKRERVAVTVEPFEDLTTRARGAVEDEAERLAAFLGGRLDLVWA